MKKSVLFLLMLALLIPFDNKIDAKTSSVKAPGIALEDTKGQFTMLSSLLSNSNIVISFWSYDCVPCREEMPELQKMAATKLFKEKNVKVVFIYVEATTAKTKKGTAERSPKEKALEVLQKLEINETCLLDIYGMAFNNYRKASNIKKATIPLLYLVNKNKDILFTAIGYNEQNLKKLEAAINKDL